MISSSGDWFMLRTRTFCKGGVMIPWLGYLGRYVGTRDVPLAKNPLTGTAQQRLFLVLKVVLHALVVISKVLRLSTKSRCSRCCRAHL